MRKTPKAAGVIGRIAHALITFASKKWANDSAMLALGFAYFSFYRAHMTLTKEEPSDHASVGCGH